MSPVRGPLAERRPSDPAWNGDDSTTAGSWMARLPSPIVTSASVPSATGLPRGDHKSASSLKQQRRNEFVKCDIAQDAHVVPAGMQPHEADLGLRSDAVVPPRRAPLLPQHSKISLTTSTSAAEVDAAVIARLTAFTAETEVEVGSRHDGGASAAAADADGDSGKDGSKDSGKDGGGKGGKKAKPVVPELHDMARRIQRGLAKIQKLDAKLEAAERKAAESVLPVFGDRATTDAATGADSGDQYAIVLRTASAGGSGSVSTTGTGTERSDSGAPRADTDGAVSSELQSSSTAASSRATVRGKAAPTPGRGAAQAKSSRKGAGGGGGASTTATATDEASARGDGDGAPTPAGGAQAGSGKDFVSRNVELAGKVRHRGLTKEEEDRLRELIGPELMGDPVEGDDSGGRVTFTGAGVVLGGASSASSLLAAASTGGGGGAAAGDRVAEDELPLTLRVPGFEPLGDDKARLRLLDDRLHDMVAAGTACEAASHPYPRPLKLFPVFLTALESQVRLVWHGVVVVRPCAW